MNWKNLFSISSLQDLLTMVINATAGMSALLVYFGCTAQLDCTVANVPSWMLPYLIGTAAVVGVMKTFVSIFSGRFGVKTVPVSSSGAPGTVTETQVQTG